MLCVPDWQTGRFFCFLGLLGAGITGMHRHIQTRFKFSDFLPKDRSYFFLLFKIWLYLCVLHTDSSYKHAFKDQRAACRISSSLQPCKSKGVNSGCQAWPLHTERPPQHHTFLIKATSWCGFGCCDSWYNANFYHVSRVDHCSTGFGVWNERTCSSEQGYAFQKVKSKAKQVMFS